MALGVVPFVLAGGTAYAYWSASGSGSAAVASASPEDITVTGTPSDQLYPGSASDVQVSLGNPNAYPVSMTTLTVLTVTSSDEEACSAANIILDPAVSAGGYTLPSPVAIASGSSSSLTLEDVVRMDPEALDGCQGKTFTVDMTFTGAQV